MAPKADIFEQVIFFWAGVGLGLQSPYIDFFLEEEAFMCLIS